MALGSDWTNIFNANAAPDDPSSARALDMRRQIALAMMARDRKGYPKTLGEGLAAVGDAIGERMQMQKFEQQLAGYDKYMRDNPAPDAAAALKKLDQPPPRTTSEDTSTEPPVRTASVDPQDVQSEPPPVVARSSEPDPALVSPVQTSTAYPTTPPPSFFPSSPGTASSAPPSMLALTMPPPNARGTGDPIAAANLSIDGYNRMPPQAAPGPRSDVAGPMNDPQASQMAALMGTPGGAPGAQYPPTASLDPGAGATPDPNAVRNSVANRLLRNQLSPQEVASSNPMQPPGIIPATFTSPAESANNREIQTDIQAAPVRVAQAGPAPGIPQINRVTPPVTMPPPGPVPDQPANAPHNQMEFDGARLKQRGIQQGDKTLVDQGDLLLQLGQKQREKQDADNKAAWDAKIQTEQQRRQAQEAAERGAPLAQQQLTEAQAKAQAATAAAAITNKTGLPADVVQAELSKRLTNAGADVSLLKNARVAKAALDGGVFSGLGADMKIDMEKARAMFGNRPASELVSRAEMLAASTQAMVKYGLNQYQPGDPRVTNGDLIVGKAIVGGTPTQQMQTQKELVNMVLQDANNRVGEYERYHNWAVGGLPPEEGYRLRVDPIHPDANVAKAATDILLKPENINDPYVRQKFDDRFGPGSADLEIARAQRRAQRRQ